MAYQHILVGTGGAGHSLRAETRAAELARVLSARLTILSVVRVSSATQGMVAGLPMEAGALTAELYDEVQRRQVEVLKAAEARCKAQGLNVATVLESGSAGHRIVEVARERGCDLIIVGRRKLSVVGALALGSVSDHVNRNAPCDVLIVR